MAFAHSVKLPLRKYFISTWGKICKAFFKLKVKLQPQLMLTQVWLDGKDDRVESPQMSFFPALTPAWTLHNAALPRLDMGPGCVLLTFIVTPTQACRWDSLFPSSWTSKDAYRQSSKKRVLFLGCQASPPPLLPPPVPAAWGSFEVGWQGTPVRARAWAFVSQPLSCSHSYGHRSPVRKTHPLKLHCSLGG